VFYDKTLKTILTARPHLLTIRINSSLAQTLKKIFKEKNVDFVLLKKPQNSQMSAVLLARILGKRFIWVQNFTNPPTPNFFARLLLNQADRILVTSKKEIFKLKKLGFNKQKIRIKSQV